MFKLLRREKDIMDTFQIKIKTSSEVNDALLMMGVPFKKGTFFKDQNLLIFNKEENLHIWWDVRSYWSDGSIKWVFIHTRVPKGENILVLKNELSQKKIGDDNFKKDKYLDDINIENKEIKDINDKKTLLYDKNSLRIGDCVFKIENNKWTFTCSDGEIKLNKDYTDTDLDALINNDNYEIELLEKSPIAPLIRAKPAIIGSGFFMENLFRIDVKGKRLIWNRRMTWNKEGRYLLKSSFADLNINPFLNINSMRSSYNSLCGSLLISEPGKVSYNGGVQVEGYPEGRVDLDGFSLWVEKVWQRAPFALSWEKYNVKLSFYPIEVKSLGVIGGTSFRHTIHLCLGDQSNLIAGQEVKVIIEPEYICDTMAVGLINAVKNDEIIETEEQINNFPGYEKSLKSCLDSGRLTRLDDDMHSKGPPASLENEESQDKDYFGLQNYGDWPMPWGSYGSKGRRMYASNEYDPAYAYYQGYAIYGDWRYMEIAKHTAIHMTDVDFIYTSGDLRYHGYGEYAEDHEYSRTPTGDFGHYWTDGFWMSYFLNDDIWAKDAAERLSFFIMGKFISGGDVFMKKLWSGGERALGWPIVAIMGTYEATKNNDLLKFIKKIVDFIDVFTSDPDKQIEEEKGTPEEPIIWWRTALEDGCKPFMLGVIMEGLERYHRETGDVQAARSILNIAGFLINNMWLPHQATFMYEWNAFGRGHRMSRPHDLIPMFVRGIGYAYEISYEKPFMEVSEKAFHSCLWTLYNPESGGKSIGMMGRTLGAYVAMAEGWIKKDYKNYIESINKSNGENFLWNSTQEGGLERLFDNGCVVLINGNPKFEEGALISVGESYIEARFAKPVYSDKGEIMFKAKLNKNSTTWLNQRCYVHLCDDVHTKSCVSIITFYTNLHVRIYDSNRKLIEVAEGYIKDYDANGTPVKKADNPVWEEGEWHFVHVKWAAPGEVVLNMDGIEVDKRVLNRPIGGNFTRLCIGYKPGNWRLNGYIDLLKLECRKE